MKRLIPVIHVLNFAQVKANIETCIAAKVNGAFIINHVVEPSSLDLYAQYAKKIYPDFWLGANFLGVKPVDLLKKDLYYLDALWFDQTLTLEDVENKKFKGEIFSGLNFKYQKQHSGSELENLVKEIKLTSTVACTSGSGTGKEATTKKIEDLKNLLGDFPMGIASGISSENVERYLPFVDDFLVASSITDSKEMINIEKLINLKVKMKV